MIAHDGYFDNLSAVIDVCSLCSMLHAHVEALKLIIYFSGQSVPWDPRAIAYPLFLSTKVAVMYWSDPRSYIELVCLSCSLDFGFRGKCSSYRNSLCQSRLLTVTLQPCSFLFKAWVMILLGSSGFFTHASPSVDGHIIIHFGML